jgi:hypothetical protein
LASLSFRRLKSFLAITELGYDCCMLPRLDTISAAEYGLLIPSYLGDAHQASTSFNCCSYIASSAAPAFWLSGRSWKESDGRTVDIGFTTGGKADGAILAAVTDISRNWVVLAMREVATRRGTEIARLRSIAAAIGCAS